MKPTNPVPPGYKRTKVGVIPEEWEVVKLGEVFDFIKTYSNSRSHLSRNGEIEYIHYGDIHTKFKFHLDLQKERLPRISKDKIKGEPSYVKEGDLIIADASEDYADIGKSIEVINIGDKKIISGLHTFLLRDKSNYFANGYKGFLLYNKAVSKSMKKIATGVSVLGISKTNLSNIKIPLPPLKEQQKIAQILGTWDEAIAKLETLIEEKERFKKGLMQKLLSAELRFPGFEGEWEEVSLKNILKERKEYLEKGLELKHVSLTTEGVVPKSSRYDRDFLVKEENKKYKVTKLDDICYNPANLKFGVICRNTFGDGIFSPIYITFEVKKDFSIDFIGYFLTWNSFIQKVRKYEQGTVYERMAVSPKDFLLFKTIFPSKQEQQKIADVLRVADKEIELLKNELDILKEQKRGLMRKLLTGEVRVKV